MEIRVSLELRHAIGEHGVDAYPHECCGALLGTARPERSVTRLLRIDNARSPENAHNRFLVTERGDFDSKVVSEWIADEDTGETYSMDFLLENKDMFEDK